MSPSPLRSRADVGAPAAEPRGARDVPAEAPGDRALLFTSLRDEATALPLPVHGRIPRWLDGTLVRNGPALFEVGRQRLRHWFDGQAMLHAFELADGRVRYTNRFVRGRAWRANAAAGRLRYREFATDPCHALFGRAKALFRAGAVSDNAGVSVARLGDAYVALTEGALPIAFDPRTLDAAGVVAWRDAVGGNLTTAHPHVRADGTLVSFTLRFGRRSQFVVFAVAPGTRTRRVLATIASREPAYVHSFGLTARWAVLVECPLVVRPLEMLLSGRPFAESLRWEPSRATRIHLVDLAGTRPPVVHEAPPFFAFHHVNAYDDGANVVMDLIAYDDASVVDALYLDRLRDPAWRIPAGRAERWRLSTRGASSGGRAVREHAWDDATFELPRIHAGRDGVRHRYVYGAGTSGPGAFLDEVVKVDAETGVVRRWRAPRCYTGEPVFVPAPGGRREDDGVLLTLVLDGARQASALVVLDARTLDELGRAEAPHAVPAGFHGEFFDGAPRLAAAGEAGARLAG